MPRTRRPAVTLALAAALLLSACAAETDSPDPAAPSPDPASSTPADDTAATEPATPEPGSITDTTLQALRDLDPERAAAAHAHHGDGHGDANEIAQAARLSGVDPERIVIPAIGVDADVIDLGLEDNGEMEVPEDFAQTGWFRNGPKPGRVGPSVIAGHVDSRSGPAVFFRISELAPGDEIEVHGEDGRVVVFAVRETQQHPKDAFPTAEVYAGTPGPELRLITCSGEFDRTERSYRDNTIVFAERIDHLAA